MAVSSKTIKNTDNNRTVEFYNNGLLFSRCVFYWRKDGQGASREVMRELYSNNEHRPRM